jgi:hypothetical protein
MADDFAKKLAEMDARLAKAQPAIDAKIAARQPRIDAKVKQVENQLSGQAGAPQYTGPSKEYLQGVEETLAPLRQRQKDTQSSFLGLDIGYPDAALSEGEDASFAKATGATEADWGDIATRTAQQANDFFIQGPVSLGYSTAKALGHLAKGANWQNPSAQMAGLDFDEDPNMAQYRKEQQQKAVEEMPTIGTLLEGGAAVIPGAIGAGVAGKLGAKALAKWLPRVAMAPMFRPTVDLAAKVTSDPLRAAEENPLTALFMGLGGARAGVAAVKNAGVRKGAPPAQAPVEGVVAEPFSGVDTPVTQPAATPWQRIGDVLMGRSPDMAQKVAPKRTMGDLPFTDNPDILQPAVPSTPTPTRLDVWKSRLPQSVVEFFEPPRTTQARLERAAGVSAENMPTVSGPEIRALNELRSQITETPQTAQEVFDVLKTFDPKIQSLREAEPTSAKVSQLLSDPVARENVGWRMLGEQERGFEGRALPPEEGSTVPIEIRSGVPTKSHVYGPTKLTMKTELETPHVPLFDEAVGRAAGAPPVKTVSYPSMSQQSAAVEFPKFGERAEALRSRIERLKNLDEVVQDRTLKYNEKTSLLDDLNARLLEDTETPPAVGTPERTWMRRSAPGELDRATGRVDRASDSLQRSIEQQEQAPELIERAEKKAAALDLLQQKYNEAVASGAAPLAQKYVETVLPAAARILGRSTISDKAAVDLLFDRVLGLKQAGKSDRGARFIKSEGKMGELTTTPSDAPAQVASPQAAFHGVLTDLIHDLSLAETYKAVFDTMPKAGEYQGPLRPINFQLLAKDPGTRTLLREMARTRTDWFNPEWETLAGTEKTAIPPPYANLLEYMSGMPRGARLKGQRLAEAAMKAGQDIEQTVNTLQKKMEEPKGKLRKSMETIAEAAYKPMRTALVAANWVTGFRNWISNYTFGEMVAADHGIPSPKQYPLKWAKESLSASRDVYRGNLGRFLAEDQVSGKSISLGDTLTALGSDPTRLAEIKGFTKIAGVPVLPTVKGLTVDTFIEARRAAKQVMDAYEGALKGARRNKAEGLISGLGAGLVAGMKKAKDVYFSTPETIYGMGMRSDLSMRVPMVKFLLEKGYPFGDAIRIAKKGLLDYGNSSRFTGEFGKWVVPFWTFSAKATPVVLEYISRHPARAMFWMQAANAANMGGAMAEGMTPEQYQTERDRRGILGAGDLITGKDTGISLGGMGPKTWVFDLGLNTAGMMQEGAKPFNAFARALSKSTGVPIVDIAHLLVEGRDPKTREPMRSFEQNPVGAAWDYGSNLASKYLVPPTVQHGYRAFRRQTTEPTLKDSPTGEVPTFGQDILKLFTGILDRKVNPEERDKKIQQSLQRDFNEERSGLRTRARKLRVLGDISGAESVEEVLRKFEERR